MEKECSQCKNLLDEACFYSNKDGKFGLTSKCKDCIQYNARLRRRGLYEPKGRKGINKGEKNGMWAGDYVCYTGLHSWIKTRLDKPECCDGCGLKTKKLDLANISQEYLRDINDWEWLCRRCHMNKDGRMGNLLVGKVKRKDLKSTKPEYIN